MNPPNSKKEWEPLARLVLEADYEGALLAAIFSGSETVILTMVGGGVFGNPKEWIIDAINRAITRIRKLKVKLTIKIAHYKKYDDDYTKNIK
jgi:O-acetyl-ADP-ribose deacetylase (regulator of RNase III)